ncbi:molecular chaperone TorD family protein [Herbaspirillum sp. ST 5-3]|uniref:molecular chaperone TorD family protein n=1 Tax=Oxalobacteraceae TaxID=75682 RepID=UPI0010A37032|nr:molecular chaperone TorD family protein [Herbaspirillum sp. ST 5-3]
MNTIEIADSVCHILANAFMPPASPGILHAFRTDLAEDLAALAEEEALDIGNHVAALRAALSVFQDDEALLVHYSRLFLVPPMRARLNLGCYLDGSLNGPAIDAIEYLLGRYGVGKQEDFRDLPDHVSCLLEFLGMLSDMPETDADRVQLAQYFLLPGLTSMTQAIEEDGDVDSPYLHLARIALTLLQQMFPADEATRNDRREKRRKARLDLNKGIWRNCGACGKPYAREKEIQIMAKALQLQGLPAEHLSICPDCRSGSQKWFSPGHNTCAGG